jgi:uncharacterized membrane protein YphA (DoxX/SURF4 family)
MPASDQIGSLILRLGLAALYLWFGLSQVIQPTDWVSWLPVWTERLPVGPTVIVIANGAFETVFGLFLAVGFQTRFAAALLALHLYFITYEIGYNAVGVRDFAIATATLAVAFLGADRFTMDARWKKHITTTATETPPSPPPPTPAPSL